MAENAELAFVKNHLNVIGSLPVQFPDEYQQPPSSSLKKIPIIPVDLPPPPPPKSGAEATTDIISVTFKVSKPAKSFTLPVSTADPISAIKIALASQPGAPPADAQRLLLRGKALADGKLLREYPVKSGDTINLMLRPGFEWNWEAPPVTPAKGKDKEVDPSMQLDPDSRSRSVSRTPSHSRIPSVVLSPSPSSPSLTMQDNPSQITLSLDTTDATMHDAPTKNAYQEKISSPEFWDRLFGFLKIEFSTPEDAESAFESFLVGVKGYLTPSEIAKIRDTVGVVGMGGT